MSETRGIGIPLKRVQPIHRGIHDATKAYETLDIVVNASNTAAYMAVQDVPVGTALTDAGYWEAIVNVSSVVDNVNSAVNANKEELQNSIDANKKETDEAIGQLSSEIADESAARDAAITLEKNRAVAREDEIEALFVLPTQEAVDKWLDEHPEATTTVQDKSLTIDKMVVGTLGYVTPEMFGAKGDGVTDDTKAIQSAINSGVNVVKFLNKTYYVTSAVNLESNLELVGNNTNIYVKSNAQLVDCFLGTGIKNIKIRGFNFFSIDDMPTVNSENYSEGLSSNVVAIHMTNVKDIIIEHCTFDYMHDCIKIDDNHSAITIANNINITVRDCKFFDNIMPIYMGCAKDCNIYNNKIDCRTGTSSHAHHIYLSSACENINIHDNTFLNGEGHDINSYSAYPNSTQPTNIHVYHNLFLDFKQLLAVGGDMKFEDNYCSSQKAAITIYVFNGKIEVVNCTIISNAKLLDSVNFDLKIINSTIETPGLILDGNPNYECSALIIGSDITITNGLHCVSVTEETNSTYHLKDCVIKSTIRDDDTLLMSRASGQKLIVEGCTIINDVSALYVTYAQKGKAYFYNNTIYNIQKLYYASNDDMFCGNNVNIML